jgi:ubiquinone/menaquinone biosynthesis C-methylase UbiE
VSHVTDYSEVTEVPGDNTTLEAISMLYTRYTFAASFCDGKDLLEVGCGTGVGLGYLAERASNVVGADYTQSLLARAQRRHGSRFPLVRLDACVLPFRAGSFDVVVLFEAIYYLSEPGRFMDECRRVLRGGGTLVICSANCERRGFRPSPHAISYFSAEQLQAMLKEHGFQASTYAAFPVSTGVRRSALDGVRWLARSLRLTKGMKILLKRVLFGRSRAFPSEVTHGMADVGELVPLQPETSLADFSVVYAVGRLP